MAKWFRVCESFEEEAEADREYWLRFSPEERVALIDTMRAEWAERTGQPQPSRGYVQFLSRLNRLGIHMLFVGAHAVAFHTKAHYTDDLELFVEDSEENAPALHDVSAYDLGYQIHIATHLAGVTFEEAWRNRVEARYAGERVFFISREDLLRSKDAAGGTQDRADAELLRSFVKA